MCVFPVRESIIRGQAECSAIILHDDEVLPLTSGFIVDVSERKDIGRFLQFRHYSECSTRFRLVSLATSFQSPHNGIGWIVQSVLVAFQARDASAFTVGDSHTVWSGVLASHCLADRGHRARSVQWCMYMASPLSDERHRLVSVPITSERSGPRGSGHVYRVVALGAVKGVNRGAAPNGETDPVPFQPLASIKPYGFIVGFFLDFLKPFSPVRYRHTGGADE